MQQPELKFKNKIASIIKSAGGHVQPIESNTGSGIPDLNVFYALVESWFEIKIDTGRGTLLRPAQRVWLYQRAKRGGNAYVISHNQKNGDVSIWLGADYKPGTQEYKPLHTTPAGKYLRITAEPDKVLSIHDLKVGLLVFLAAL